MNKFLFTLVLGTLVTLSLAPRAQEQYGSLQKPDSGRVQVLATWLNC